MFKARGGNVPQTRVTTFAVIEHFDPLKNHGARLSTSSPRFVQLEFRLEGGKKALSHSIVPTFSLTTHALDRLQALEGLSILKAGILHSLIRVMQQPCFRLPIPAGHLERTEHQIRV